MVARSYETRNSGSMANDIPRLVLEYHINEDIAGKYLSADTFGLSVLYADLFFNRNKHLEDPILHSHGADPLFKVGLYLILVSRISLDNIPTAFLCIAKNFAHAQKRAAAPLTST